MAQWQFLSSTECKSDQKADRGLFLSLSNTTQVGEHVQALSADPGCRQAGGWGWLLHHFPLTPDSPICFLPVGFQAALKCSRNSVMLVELECRN